MSHILIHLKIFPHGEYDIFNKTNLEKSILHIQRVRNGDCPNFGNKLWFQGIMSFIINDDNQIDFYDEKMTFDYINSTYDFIIAPMANIFSTGYVDVLNNLANYFSCIKIPTYVIACGIQVKSYNEIHQLSKDIKEPAYRFIQSIYSTGGEFALRGQSTKKFFDYVCENTAIVTGCPSMFQLDSNLVIDFSKLKKRNLKIAVNGDIDIYHQISKQYQCEFFDQHEYYQLLYDINLETVNFQALIKLVKNYGYDTIYNVIENKIHLFFDMNAWWNYLQNNHFDVTIGTRIHGTIMSILAGIPALLVVIDERTKEMADFFSIPYIEYKDFHVLQIRQLIDELDYNEFNRTFSCKYYSFEKFLCQHNIQKDFSIKKKKKFFYHDDCIYVDSYKESNVEKYSLKFKKYKRILLLYNQILQLNRKCKNMLGEKL